MSRIESALCPVCGSWFYREKKRGNGRVYDKPECKVIGRSVNAARRRQVKKKLVN